MRWFVPFWKIVFSILSWYVVAYPAPLSLPHLPLRFHDLHVGHGPHILLYPFRPVHSYLLRHISLLSRPTIPLASYLSMCSQNSSFSCSVHPVFYHSFCENNRGPIIILSFIHFFPQKTVHVTRTIVTKKTSQVTCTCTCKCTRSLIAVKFQILATSLSQIFV